jgi:5-methylcytosine-specific restriction protein A
MPSRCCSHCYCVREKCRCPTRDSHKYAPSRELTRGAAWKRLRLSYLAAYPLCAMCLEQDIIKAATDVHHIIKPGASYDLLYDWDNLQSLCHECHSVLTAKGE